MKTIDAFENWGSTDSLDQWTLVDGEVLRIKWPDGSTTDERICVEVATFEYDDMGHRCTGTNHLAYVFAMHRGIASKIYLRGMPAERVHAPKGKRWRVSPTSGCHEMIR